MPDYEPVSKPLVENLLTMARAFAKAKGIKLASVSRLAHGDPPALENLSRGKGSVSLRKYDSTMAWFHSRWPDGVGVPVLPFDIRISSRHEPG